MKILTAICMFGCVAAFGGTIISMQPVSVGPGGSGGFDVALTNTGPSAITVAGFTFGITVTAPAVNLTNANTATVLYTYIFNGHSLFGPDLTGPTSGQAITVSDVYIPPMNGSTVGAGASAGLGRVLFSTSSNALGSYSTNFIGQKTSLADPAGNAIPITAMNGGSITVVSITAIPEPGSAVLVLAGAAGLVCLRKRRR